MRTTCLINNYNYQDYLCEAVNSALEQTHPFDEVIVVDDGSTDESLRLLRQSQRYESLQAEGRMRVVSKENGGQLSAFNAGVQQMTGDLVFFLDADDRYCPEYLAQAIDLYRTREIDFAIAGVKVFGPAATTPRRLWAERNLGYSTLSAILSKAYIGGPTSALSMRREIAEQVLPCPFENDWRTRADDVLVLGSSIAGARKFQMETALVDYRVHGQNNFSGRQRDATRKLQHGLAVNRLVHWYVERSGYDVAELPRLLHREFATIEQPTFDEWWQYTKMSWRARLPLSVRARHLGETSLHYWRERLASSATQPHRATPPAQPLAAKPLPSDGSCQVERQRSA